MESLAAQTRGGWVTGSSPVMEIVLLSQKVAE
jgi:hypothetical protein